MKNKNQKKTDKKVYDNEPKIQQTESELTALITRALWLAADDSRTIILEACGKLSSDPREVIEKTSALSVLNNIGTVIHKGMCAAKLFYKDLITLRERKAAEGRNPDTNTDLVI